MPGRRKSHQRVQTFLVADLPHHYDIGSLPQNPTRPSREVIRTLVVYLRLADTGQEYFDRRLGGENIVRGSIQRIQDAVNGRRFTRARWPA